MPLAPVLAVTAVCLAFSVRIVAESPAEAEFVPWFNDRDVSVRIAYVAGRWPWIEGVGAIDARADVVAARLTDWVRYPELFAPALVGVTVLERQESAARLHMVWRVPFPFRDRDGIVRYAVAREHDGSWRIDWRDAARPGDPATGVRIDAIAGTTRIEPLGPERCRITYRYLGDLGGDFGTWLNERAWRAEPVHYITSLRAALAAGAAPPP